MGLCYEEPSGICRGRKAAGGPPCILGRNVQAVAQVCDEARGAADHAFICHLVCKVLVDPTEQALAATALSKRDEITLCETDSQPESIFKLFDSFFRGHTQTEEIDPLYVFKHVDPNGEIGLFSRNNRRLMAQQRMCSQNCTRCP